MREGTICRFWNGKKEGSGHLSVLDYSFSYGFISKTKDITGKNLWTIAEYEMDCTGCLGIDGSEKEILDYCQKCKQGKIKENEWRINYDPS